MIIAEVLVNTLVYKTFSYECEESCKIGQVVSVQLRNRIILGVVCSIEEKLESEITFQIKKIKNYFPFYLDDVNLNFLNWVSEYNFIPKGIVYKMITPFFVSEIEKEGRKDKKQQYDLLKSDELISHNEEQKKAIDSLTECNNFSVYLLDGVTGSGKTETYISSVIKIIKKSEKNQILILLPEIALTSLLLKRFEKYFGFMPHVWHSNTTKVQKCKIWKKAISGEHIVVIGTRSAIFIPFKNLGVIVIDEEHDSSYKQNEQGSYHARDMAIVKAKMLDIPVILSSATPSIETFENVHNGKYKHVVLTNRFSNALMPEVFLIDMKKEDIGTILSWELIDNIKKSLEKKEQVLLFINQRGYAPVSVCAKCGTKNNCPMCDVNLIYHKKNNLLLCHHCGFEKKWEKTCNSCGKESMILFGVGIEKVVESVKYYFPSAKILSLSSDNVSSKQKWDTSIDAIEKNDIDIIIGTQILSKGHHFPNLTLVGVIDAEQNSLACDLRANEKTYQLMHQVAGRAGRGQKKGKVFLQTYNIESALMRSLVSYNRDDFYSCEIEQRKMYNMPPFSRLISVIISGRNEINVEKEARRIARELSSGNDITVLGPVPAPLARLRGKYRHRLLIKLKKNNLQHSLIKKIVKSNDNSVFVYTDVDPYDFS